MAQLNTKYPPFNDIEVRRAFREAIDLDGIFKALWGGKYLRAWGPLTQFTPGYDRAVENTWRYDPASANKRAVAGRPVPRTVPGVGTDALPPLSRCRDCGWLRPAGAPGCRACTGWIPPVASPREPGPPGATRAG